MTRKTGVLLAIAVVVVAAATGAGFWLNKTDVPAVMVETLRTRDLEALVSASGKIQPKRQVNISANTMGRVTRLAVEEGQRVRAG